MKIDDDWKLEGNKHGWILKGKVVTEYKSEERPGGKVRWEKYYYPSLKKALTAYMDKSLRSSGTIDEILDRLNSLPKTITKAVDDANINFFPKH